MGLLEMPVLVSGMHMEDNFHLIFLSYCYNIIKQKTCTFSYHFNQNSFVGKLREFNNNIDVEKKVEDNRLARLEGMMKEVLPSDDDLNTLKAVLEWPPSKLL